MTRKDYERLASMLCDWYAEYAPRMGEQTGSAYRVLCAGVADCLRRENPRFDRDKFLRACGLALSLALTLGGCNTLVAGQKAVARPTTTTTFVERWKPVTAFIERQKLDRLVARQSQIIRSQDGMTWCLWTLTRAGLCRHEI